MISSKQFVNTLQDNGVRFFAGVPDSLLKPFCAYVESNVDPQKHVITSNEGAAVALGLGYHLATGQTPLIYLQNSGLGNLVNPLLSLVDNEIYGAPMLILMGWRGEPGVKDEPQHIKQGKVMNAMLDAMDIPHLNLSKEFGEAQNQLKQAISHAKQHSCPFVITVSKNTFDSHETKITYDKPFSLQREQAIDAVVDAFSGEDTIWVATTGMISRELYEIREQKSQSHQQDFLTVGGMGHASSIALGIAREHPNKKIICLDGDGAALMHLGALSTIGNQNCKNFYHVMLNNGAHDSVGGQPTVALDMDWPQLTQSMGYKASFCLSDKQALQNTLGNCIKQTGPIFIEIKVNRGNRFDLGRPKITPQAAKDAFMTYVLSQR